MGTRVQLQSLLESLLGSRNVYFQPPENIKLLYPCIIYSYDLGKTKFADNIPYSHRRRYQLILVDANPDSEFIDTISELPMCVFDRSYKSDNLNHYTYDIYY